MTKPLEIMVTLTGGDRDTYGKSYQMVADAFINLQNRHDAVRVTRFPNPLNIVPQFGSRELLFPVDKHGQPKEMYRDRLPLLMEDRLEKRINQIDELDQKWDYYSFYFNHEPGTNAERRWLMEMTGKGNFDNQFAWVCRMHAEIVGAFMDQQPGSAICGFYGIPILSNQEFYNNETIENTCNWVAAVFGNHQCAHIADRFRLFPNLRIVRPNIKINDAKWRIAVLEDLAVELPLEGKNDWKKFVVPDIALFGDLKTTTNPINPKALEAMMDHAIGLGFEQVCFWIKGDTLKDAKAAAAQIDLLYQ